jgi:LysM repeat protein
MKKPFPTLLRRWIGLALLLMILFTNLTGGYGLAQGTTVLIDPAGKEVAVGATTTVNVRIENVTNLYGAEVHLVFNPTLLEVVDADSGRDGVQIQPGSFLSPDFMAKNNADQTSGRIVFAVAQMPPHEPVSGSGILATITFRGKAAGTSVVDFSTTQPTSPVILSDRDGMPINAGTRGGNITVTGGPSPTPTFTPTPGPTPTFTPTPSVTPTPKWGILGHHTVQPKETLYCIGRAYGVDPYAIAKQNGILNPSIIRAGQRLAIPNASRRLPAGKVCPRQFDGTPPPPRCRWNHTVAPGENLYRISLRYKVSMWAIAEANHILNLNYIRAGEVLCIP